MTEVKIVSKKTTFVIETLYVNEDETVDSLLYWVHVMLAVYSGAFAQFQYKGSTYVVSIKE